MNHEPTWPTEGGALPGLPIGDNPWYSFTRGRPDARLRMFCFPYAGGGASIFRTWPDDLPAEVEVCPVQLPGHETRAGEQLIDRMAPMVQAIAASLRPYLDRPFALFGYSMGGLIAFELARHLQIQGQEPELLMVAARRSPGSTDPRSPIHGLPEDAFIEALAGRYQGLPSAVRDNAELMAFFSPILRADFALFETYQFVPSPPLSCPVSVFGGNHDPVQNRGDLAAWASHTLGRFDLETFDGGHFFLNTHRNQLLAAIGRRIEPLLSAVARG